MTIARQAAGLRVVLDTNVYFSAFTHPKGVPFSLWQHAILNRYSLLVSPAIVGELGGVLRLKGGWEDDQIISQLKLLVKVAELVAPKSILTAIAADDDDNRILECAVDGRAALIVSSDRHLRQLKTFQGIAIVHPIDFQRTLAE